MERLAADVGHATSRSPHAADGAAGGARRFRIVWAAEHHALEMTIAPNPFQILTWWAAHTERIRLGSAVAVAPYWHR